MRITGKDKGVAYAEAVVKGDEPACKWVKLAYARFLDELARSQKDESFPWVYDFAEAKKASEFFPRFIVLSGANEQFGKPLKLFGWQEGIVSQIFGWQKRDGGGRRYSTVYVEAAKGCGKSPFAAAIAMRMVFFDGRKGAQGFAFAFNRDQAKLVFNPACEMAKAINDRIKDRNRRFNIRGEWPYEYNIVFRPNRQAFQTVTSQKEARGKGGSAVWFAAGDEICEHRDGTMVRAMVDGMKFNRGPLCFLITNAGANRQGVAWEYNRYSRKILDDRFPNVENDEFLGLIYTVDDDDDPWTDESCWSKANPSIDVTPGYEYYRRAMKESGGMPGKMAETDRLYFSRWTEGQSPFVDARTYYKCTTCEEEGGRPASEFPSSEERAKLPCWMACDLAWTRDLTSFGIVWYDRAKKTFYGKSYCWLPKARFAEYGRRDDVDYDGLVKDGYLAIGSTLNSEDIIDFTVVAEWVGEVARKYNPRVLAFDPHRWKALNNAMRECGVNCYVKGEGGSGLACVPHKQGKGLDWKNKGQLVMPRSLEDLERLIYQTGSDNDGILMKHNPLLASAFLSAEVDSDAHNNRTLVKSESECRIDPAVAMTMAVGAAVMHKDKRTSSEDLAAFADAMRRRRR